MHRGHLYDRWKIAHQENPDPQEQRAGNDKSDTSRGDITLALYELRVRTRHTYLLRLAEEAVDATYAVKRRGEELAAVTAADLDAPRERGIAADTAFLTATSAL
ncbi:hypothetical protein [Streptomyces mirabilis]|uniref:hypothetical protein n=1 Tax=Streptomyces mirabilis TaxID=68239 RepID=UPI0037F3F8A3